MAHGAMRLLGNFCLTISGSLSGAYGESRDTRRTELELAVELFGSIAEQSRCSIYAVAWVDPVTQQAVSCRAETLLETARVARVIAAEIFAQSAPHSRGSCKLIKFSRRGKKLP